MKSEERIADLGGEGISCNCFFLPVGLNLVLAVHQSERPAKSVQAVSGKRRSLVKAARLCSHFCRSNRVCREVQAEVSCLDRSLDLEAQEGAGRDH